ncbi:MAG: dTDP-4-dehydrorhamnose 3,5-epimerase family protein [Egibacteraceae bacterium]
MAVEPTDLAGLWVVRWETNADERGFFRQTYQARELAEALGRKPGLVQGNHSRSAPGVLRGFHAEPWDKLVYAVRGTAFAAIADIRPESPTFGEVRTFVLGDEGERARLFITSGLANSFAAVDGEPLDYLYDVSDYWRPGIEKRAVAWDDPDLAVDWPLRDPILSDADMKNPTLRELHPDHPRWTTSQRG